MELYDPLENLKLLSPHAQQTQIASMAFARLTPYDIAASLAYAKLGRGPTLLARIKIAGQTNLYPELRHWLKVEIYPEIVRKPENIHETMVDSCLAEVIDSKICEVCHGRGYGPDPNGKIVACPGQEKHRGRVSYRVECREGRSPWTENKRSERLGVHHDVYRRHHQRLYLDILTIPWTWESQVRQAVA